MSISLARKPKALKVTQKTDQDADFLKSLFQAIISSGPRGSLTYLAHACGAPNPSHMRKRLLAVKTFDPITMRAILLAQELHAEPDETLTDETRAGNFIIGWRVDDTLGWRYEE